MWLLRCNRYGSASGDVRSSVYGVSYSHWYGQSCGDGGFRSSGKGAIEDTRYKMDGSGFGEVGPEPDHLLILAALQGAHHVVT